jgi:sporulation protein YtfJ
MEEHPIQGLMQTAMENLKEMVDVNTIIGEPVETATGQLIIPVSKVGFGFAAGGSEFQVGHKKEERQNGHGKGDHGSDQGQEVSYPFGGGSGGGVSITPVAFIVVGEKDIRVLNMERTTHLYDRLIEQASKMIDKLGDRNSKKKVEHEPDID